MIHPPGPLAHMMNVDSVVTCRCGHDEYNLLSRYDLDREQDILAVAHCVKCHHEVVVPLDKEVKQRPFINYPKTRA